MSQWSQAEKDELVRLLAIARRATISAMMAEIAGHGDAPQRNRKELEKWADLFITITGDTEPPATLKAMVEERHPEHQKVRSESRGTEEGGRAGGEARGDGAVGGAGGAGDGERRTGGDAG